MPEMLAGRNRDRHRIAGNVLNILKTFCFQHVLFLHRITEATENPFPGFKIHPLCALYPPKMRYFA